MSNVDMRDCSPPTIPAAFDLSYTSVNTFRNNETNEGLICNCWLCFFPQPCFFFNCATAGNINQTSVGFVSIRLNHCDIALVTAVTSSLTNTYNKTQSTWCFWCFFFLPLLASFNKPNLPNSDVTPPVGLTATANFGWTQTFVFFRMVN